MNRLRLWWKGLSLKSTEQKWKLYDKVPKLQLEWTFLFIYQKAIGGHHCSSVTLNDEATIESVAVVNLFPAATEESLICTMNHEALHVAIRTCLGETTNFEETVIQEWMGQGKLCVINGKAQIYGVK